jgi:hypothetical protein
MVAEIVIPREGVESSSSPNSLIIYEFLVIPREGVESENRGVEVF